MVLVKIVSPATLTVMAKIVMDHICSTQEHACTPATNQSEHYDPYDKSNNQAAHLFLLDSLDPHLQQSIEDRAPQRTSPSSMHGCFSSKCCAVIL